MNFIKYFFLIIVSYKISIFATFIPNANIIITSEQNIFNKILEENKLYCHLQSSRIKTFKSSMQKLKSMNFNDIYDLYDLIAFRYVFYEKEDLLKFYHHIKQEKEVWYTKNYISEPKENGYSAIHTRYKNIYKECPIKQLECQLYIIDDYYDSLYGNSKYGTFVRLVRGIADIVKVLKIIEKLISFEKKTLLS